MVSREEKRQKSYKYIVEKLRQLERDGNYTTDKRINDVNYISLAEIEELKEGITDPTVELVARLKKLLQHVASESEIDEHLVKPFLAKY